MLPVLMQDGEKGAHRPLEDEPLLAARMVIEDCMNLLLDVDDIDRLWAAQGTVSSQKRCEQACGLATSCCSVCT